jgi:hypothetical protein
MSAPSPNAGRPPVVADVGNCEHTGVIQSEMANNASRGLDFGDASFKVFVPTRMENPKTVSCSNYVNRLQMVFTNFSANCHVSFSAKYTITFDSF